MYYIDMEVSLNGETLKWMVSNGKSYKMDDLGVALFQETSIYSIQLKHIYIYTYIYIHVCIHTYIVKNTKRNGVNNIQQHSNI